MTKKKTNIIPPRIPKNENHRITIGNQLKQINILIDRIECLTKERDQHISTAKLHKDQIQKLTFEVESINLNLSVSEKRNRDLQNIISRMNGWQDCAREVFKSSRELGLNHQ